VIRSTRAIALIDDGRYQRSGHVAATLARGGNWSHRQDEVGDCRRPPV